MCLAIPAQVITLDADSAIIATDLQQMRVGRALVPELEMGDWVLVHAGQIIMGLTPAEAASAQALIRELQAITAVGNPETAD
jgi:hydrogenase expression/formation protein HypC